MEQSFSAENPEFYHEESPSPYEKPLDRLLDDDNIRIMEHFIPYVDAPANRLLALSVKLVEIQKILRNFEGPQLRACGLESDNRDMESILRTLRKTVSPEMGAQIDSLLQVFDFSRMYQRFNQITREHPEILQMMSSNRSGQSGSTADAFSDPSLFMLLSSMLNNNDGDSRDRMKNVLELAMKGSSENMDMTNLLATLMNNNRQG